MLLASSEEESKVTAWRGEELAGSRAEGRSAKGAGRQAAISLRPGAAEMHVSIFQSSQRGSSYIRDLLNENFF